MLGAAGSVEFIVAVLMLQHQKISPCLNSDILNDQLEPFQSDPNWKGCKEPMAAYRHLLPQQATDKEINRIACINYGFGNTNSAIISRE